MGTTSVTAPLYSPLCPVHIPADQITMSNGLWSFDFLVAWTGTEFLALDIHRVLDNLSARDLATATER